MTAQTASLPEILSMTLNLIGLAAALWMFHLTAQRHRAVIKTGGSWSGPRSLVAMRHYRCEGSRSAFHIVAIGLGVWAMTLPGPTSAYGEAVVWSRVLFAVMFTTSSLMDIASDSRLENLLSDRRQSDDGAGR